jgi:hypothetical protein
MTHEYPRDSRQMRISTPSVAMYKDTVWLAARWSGRTSDCAANATFILSTLCQRRSVAASL